MYSGSAYLFRFNDPNWVEEQKLTAPDAQELDYFGWSVAAKSGKMVIGADSKDNETGAAYTHTYQLCPTADLSGNCFVNFDDFAIIADQWLISSDMDDLLILAQQWLTGQYP
jgi:hypothetical protein